MAKLHEQGVDTDKLMNNMKTAIASTLLSMEAEVVRHLTTVIRTDCKQCYQLLGTKPPDTPSRCIRVLI